VPKKKKPNAKAKPKKPTIKQIEAFLERQKKRLDLQAECDALERDEKQELGEMLDYTLHAGGAYMVGKFILSLATKKSKSVKWKNVAIEIAGPEEAQRVAENHTSSSTSNKLTITTKDALLGK